MSCSVLFSVPIYAHRYIYIRIPAGESRKLMRKYDTDGDGVMSFEEFRDNFRHLVLFQIAELRDR